MRDISNYPWYIQQAPRFVRLYEGFYNVFLAASPITARSAFDVGTLTGTPLLNFGLIWGLRGAWGGSTDGLIYNIDAWSTDRVWTGSMRDTDASIYRNFIRMKAYINGRPYTLQLIKEALEILVSDSSATFWVEEGYMSFVIHIKASGAVLNMFYNMTQYDPFFLGKPTGISYTWEYEQQTE